MRSTLQIGEIGVITSDESRLYRRITWRIIPLLMMCYMLAFLDRTNIGYARLAMLSDLGFSEAVYGLGAGIFFIGYAACEIPSNLIMHRVGARRWISRIMVTWGTLSVLMMFVKTPAMFYVLRLLLGIAEAGLLPGVILYLTYWYPAHRRGQVVAAFTAGLPLSGVLGGPISGWIMRQMAGVHGWAGWQWLFLLEGLPTVLIGVFVFWYLDDRIERAKWLSDSEKLLLSANIAEDTKDVSHTSLLGVFKDPQIWIFCVIYFNILLGVTAIAFWLPAIIQSTGVKDTFHIGLLGLIPYGTAIVAMVSFGRSADRNRERRWHMVIPMIISALGFSLIGYGGSQVIVIVGLTAAAAGSMASMSLFWALPTAVLSDKAAAAGIGLISSIGIVSGFVSPYMFGVVKTLTNSIVPALYAHSVLLLVGALLAIFLVQARLVNK
ncbi:MFS transporter [Paraburkholderia bengalensis]|uniref:MFS transporter n=1 Tax=Paraburkholderia bengalensis TaxID=2747562 RepID=A0ABU8ILD0_9BURK